MISTDWTPTANHLLISVPSRYEAPNGPRSPEGLGITLIAGEDAMNELIAQIKTGGQLQIETESEQSIRNLVRVGQVLQVPPMLTDQMVLCAAGEGYRTFADITPVVEVGDTVYLDHSCLIDENEMLPGIYRVPYSAVICVIDPAFVGLSGMHHSEFLIPVGGYVLLSRVWAADVCDYEIDGEMRKVRFGKGGYLIDQVDVLPLDNEGVVKWVHEPLKGALDELHPGQRVVIAKGQALVETICGESYLVVRHDYCLAVREQEVKEWMEFDLNAIEASGELPAAYIKTYHATGNDPLQAVTKRALSQNPFTKEFQRLPLYLSNYDA